MCRECQNLAKQFAISTRLYAEAAARVGTSGGTLVDYARLMADADAALCLSQDACAALKKHARLHLGSAASKPDVD